MSGVVQLGPGPPKVITESPSGGRKETKQERFDLIPWDAVTELARLYGAGAEKYEDRNWEKGYNNSLSMAALLRHLSAWWQEREAEDSETGQHHLMSVVFHAFAMWRFEREFPEYDKRP